MTEQAVFTVWLNGIAVRVLMVCVKNGGCPSRIRPNYPRKIREDGWGTRAVATGQNDESG